LLHLAAVSIENPVVKIRVWLPRPFHLKNLVASHSQVAVGEKPQLARVKVQRTGNGIQNHEVIAQSMHFSES
jgi:hypothetical protein